MSHRVAGLLLALCGAAIVLAIVTLGCDVRRSARTGPRWKRRLVGAGLALLAALGLPGCDDAGQAGTGRPATSSDAGSGAKTLTDAAGWQRLVATWRESAEIASGKRGAYPFDRKGRERALKALDTAVADVDALRKSGLLNDGEAGLLRLDLAQLKLGVQGKRPTEMRMATCYEPMALTPARDSVRRLSARLPLLEKLAAADKLRPAVVRKVLASIEADLATLSNDQIVNGLPEAQRPQAQSLREQVQAKVDALNARLAKPAPDPEQ